MWTIYLLWINIWFAQENPTLDQLMQEHYKAINIERLNQINSLEMKGYVAFYLNESQFKYKEAKLSGNFTEFILLPNQRYYESSFKGVAGNYIQGYNDGRSWTKDGGGFKKNALNKKDALIFEQKFDITPNLYNCRPKGFTPSMEGKKSIEGKKYYCIKLTANDEVDLFYYLDTKTYVVKLISIVKEDGEYENWEKMYFDDYKNVDGIIFPHKQCVKIKYGGNVTTMLYNYTDVKIDIDIDRSIFEMPIN